MLKMQLELQLLKEIPCWSSHHFAPTIGMVRFATGSRCFVYVGAGSFGKPWAHVFQYDLFITLCTAVDVVFGYMN